MIPTDMNGTISATPGNGMRLTYSARLDGRMVAIGNANRIDAAIAAIVTAGVPRNGIEFADTTGARRSI